MAHRHAHGEAAKHGATSVQETLPVDELPKGKVAPQDTTTVTAAAESGRFEKGNKRSSLGGRARKGKPRMAERVSLTPPGEELPIAKYHKAAKAFATQNSASLAKHVGGGFLDSHTGSLVMSAARALKWANYYSDLAATMPPGSVDQREAVKLMLDADQKASTHVRNAHDYAAKMAEARARSAEEAEKYDYYDPFADNEDEDTEDTTAERDESLILHEKSKAHRA